MFTNNYLLYRTMPRVPVNILCENPLSSYSRINRLFYMLTKAKLFSTSRPFAFVMKVNKLYMTNGLVQFNKSMIFSKTIFLGVEFDPSKEVLQYYNTFYIGVMVQNTVID